MLKSVIDIVETLATRVRAPQRPPAFFEEPGKSSRPSTTPRREPPIRADRAEAGKFHRPPAGEVDALDGAVQLLQGLPQYCLTVTLVRDGEPELAVLHSPNLKETYAARKGEGATPIAPRGSSPWTPWSRRPASRRSSRSSRASRKPPGGR